MTVTTRDIALAEEATVEALENYQNALKKFDSSDPPLKATWTNWDEDKAREQRKQQAVGEAHRALTKARRHLRDLVCQQARNL